MNDFNWEKYLHRLEQRMQMIGCTNFYLMTSNGCKEIISIHQHPPTTFDHLLELKQLLYNNGYNVERVVDQMTWQVYLQIDTGGRFTHE